MTERAFVKSINSRTAAEVRREVSDSFNTSTSSQAASVDVEPVVPIDYEAYIAEHRDQLLADSEKHLLLFPEDDVEVFTAPRVYRTLEIPVPGAAKRSTDVLVQECVQGFMADWHSLRRKHGSFYGSDSHAKHGFHHSDSFLKKLPSHEYEIDMDQQEVLDREERSSKMSMQSSVSSTFNDEFDSTESDELLEDLVQPVENIKQIDHMNQLARKRDHYTKLFDLYPLPSRDAVLEVRTPAPLPPEQHGLKILVKVIDLRFECTFEPIFAELALYDAKERKKISESFYMDMNSSEMYHMLDDHSRERSMASLSRNAIFSITYPNPEVFLVLRIEKVLQKGDISDAAEPYCQEMDHRTLDRTKSSAKQFCQQLGQYRMPLAWTAVNIVDIIGGRKAAGQESAPTSFEKMERHQSVSTAANAISDKHPAARDHLQRVSSVKVKEDGSLQLLSNNFAPVTITVQKFYKQESDKLSDEDLFHFLYEMRKGATPKPKLKTIPAVLKLDLSPPYLGIPGCLTSNLWQVEPYRDLNRRPTREIEEFPSKPVYHPNTVYKNMLYIYPQSLDFRKCKGRNIGVKIQFMGGEDPDNDALQVIYGHSSGPKFVRETWTTVLYHDKSPEFYNEIKVELPAQLTTRHHILFTFYHISCMKPRPHEVEFQEPNLLGYTWIPLLEDGELHTGPYGLCVCSEQLPAAYSRQKADGALPNLKWIENRKPLFKVFTHAVSTVHPQDATLSKFMKRFLEHQFEVGSEQEERELISRIVELPTAASEPLVKFLHATLNGLFCLLVRPLFSEGNALVQETAFAALSHIAHHIQAQLDLPQDKHGHNTLLASYIQHVLVAPVGPPSQGSNKSRTTVTSDQGSKSTDYKSQRTTTHSLSIGGVHHAYLYQLGDRERGNFSENQQRKLLHEEIAMMWLFSENSKMQEESMSVAWFFFGAMIKTMAQHLHQAGMLSSFHTKVFAGSYFHDLEKLVNSIAIKIAEKHILNVSYARSLNKDLAFFLMDAYSLLDRGFVCHMIRNYIKTLALAPADYNLTEFKLDLFRVVCSHEHYIALNLPILLSVDPLSPTTGSCNLPFIQLMATLTAEFKQYHFLVGLVLSELAYVLAGRTPKLREQAIELIRDLLVSHDADPRYQSQQSRERIALLYLPLLSIVLDNLEDLYHGDGWDDWARSFERTTEVRRSVIVKEDKEIPSGNKSANPVSKATTNQQQMGPSSTRNLLLCFLWVLHNIDPVHLFHWWTTLPIIRLNALLSVLDLCSACFEYKGKSAEVKQSMMPASKGTAARNRLAGVILGKAGGSATERMLQRHETMAAAVSISPSLSSGGVATERWSKTVWATPTSGGSDNRLQSGNFDIEATFEGCLAAEATLIVLDTLEILIQAAEAVDTLRLILPRVLEVLIHLLTCSESVSMMEHIFATQRSIVVKFPDLLFEEETERCADLCIRMLKHCSSAHSRIRTLASASLYLLMRQNYVNESNFSRIKVQITVALSSIVAGDLKFDEYNLRRSLKTLVTYADTDLLPELEKTDFPDQVRELSAKLHRILLDTVKLKESHEDPAVLMDLMYRISKGYQNSPDLRLSWLQYLAGKHSEYQNYPEAAMCLVHAAALVAEYLYLLEGVSYMPVGCVAFKGISFNVLEESAVSDDAEMCLEEEGMCTDILFSEKGMIGLLEQAANFFWEARLYEAVYEIYKIVVPICCAQRQFKELNNIHTKQIKCIQDITLKGDKRGFGTYFRVGFYGNIFGESVDGQEFIYREQGLTRLAEFSLKLEKYYLDKYGSDHIVMVKDSNKVQVDTLDPNKGYIQITFVEPYFDEYELQLPERSTLFDRSFNIRRFVYCTPFTMSGKAYGDISDQYMRKTILTAEEHFPYVKTRVKVLEHKEVVLSPVEVAIEDMRDKINKLKEVLSNAQDTKLLQMQLQGGIATSVNQGAYAIAHAFLKEVPTSQQNHFQLQLRMCFREFMKLCRKALDKNKTSISEEQLEYQQEMERKFYDFQQLLTPLISSERKSAQQQKLQETPYLKEIATYRASRVLNTD